MGYRLTKVRGHVVETHVSGPPDATRLLVFHLGTPSAAVGYPGLTAAAAARGMRTLIYSRPGYGRSGRIAGRTVADEAARTAVLVDGLGHREFLVAGWSGGGPAALACAALLPDRVRACLTLASPAPIREVGDGWQDWFPASEVAEIEVLATADRERYVAEYQVAGRDIARMTPTKLGSFPGGRSPVEDRALFGPTGLAVPLARSMRRGQANGMWGWFDDAVAQSIDWGFRVADIRTPVVVRQGDEDRLNDVRQGRWLAAHIPRATARILPGQGHGSILDPYSAFLDELLEAAGSPSVP